MRYEYDARTDILVLRLSSGKPDYGEQKGNIITHFTKGGKPIEIEILDASKTTKKIMDMIKRATRTAHVAMG